LHRVFEESLIGGPSNKAERMKKSQERPEADVPVGVAIVGAGYWGPNLLRNFMKHQGADVRWMCDLDVERGRAVVGRYSRIEVTADYEEVLADPAVGAVVIATPAASHAPLAIAALDAGKHVMVEKPLATSVPDGRKMIERAAERGLVLMCDHTYCYTPAVVKIRELVQSGAIGDVQYIDSVRINLGLIRPDADVIWDLAPHDLSILDFVLPDALRPVRLAASGVDPVGAGRACVAYLSLPLGENGTGATLPGLAHLHVNWLSPTKVRTMIVGGSEKMIVWDDLQPAQRLSVYDTGVDLTASDDAADSARQQQLRIAYRAGEIVAPALPEKEALYGAVTEFLGSINEGRAPATDGHAGLRVLAALEAARFSLQGGGVMTPIYSF
jgi:predicted dehydrogenase